MFKWLKRLFKKKETKVDLLIICESIKPTKPIRKRDKKGRFIK